MFYDTEHGVAVTEGELRREWEDVRLDGEHDGWTYADYVAECCGGNGTLERV